MNFLVKAHENLRQRVKGSDKNILENDSWVFCICYFMQLKFMLFCTKKPSALGRIMTMQVAVSIHRIFIRLVRKIMVLAKCLKIPRGPVELTVPLLLCLRNERSHLDSCTQHISVVFRDNITTGVQLGHSGNNQS